jgi:hypothetical protein
MPGMRQPMRYSEHHRSRESPTTGHLRVVNQALLAGESDDDVFCTTIQPPSSLLKMLRFVRPGPGRPGRGALWRDGRPRRPAVLRQRPAWRGLVPPPARVRMRARRLNLARASRPQAARRAARLPGPGRAPRCLARAHTVLKIVWEQLCMEGSHFERTKNR